MAAHPSVLAWRVPGTGSLVAAVYGVAQGRTRLKRLRSCSSNVFEDHVSCGTASQVSGALAVLGLLGGICCVLGDRNHSDPRSGYRDPWHRAWSGEGISPGCGRSSLGSSHSRQGTVEVVHQQHDRRTLLPAPAHLHLHQTRWTPASASSASKTIPWGSATTAWSKMWREWRRWSMISPSVASAGLLTPAAPTRRSAAPAVVLRMPGRFLTGCVVFQSWNTF